MKHFRCIVALLVGFMLTSCSYYFSDDYNRDNRLFYVDISVNDSTLGQVTGAGGYAFGSVVEIAAVPNAVGVFKEWNDGCIERVRTLTVEKNVTLVAYFTLADTASFEEAGHKYIDLGLPSGRLWATCNIGAENPEDKGTYFAWGETAGKAIYDWSTYTWCDGSFDSLTKYCSNIAYGTVDGKKSLDIDSDDAARVNWGGRWRTPNKKDAEELIKACTWEWISTNNVQGYKIIGPNGKHIFLPAIPATSKIQDNWIGDYMLSELYIVPEAGHAYNLFFERAEYVVGSIPRCDGQNIRAVIGGL